LKQNGHERVDTAIETVGLGRDYRLPRALDALDLMVGSGTAPCACQKIPLSLLNIP